MLAPEVKIDIAGRERIMRPRIKAIMDIESDLGANSVMIVNRVMQGDIGAKDVLTIIYHGLNGGVDRLEKADIEVELEQKGIMHFMPYVSKFLEAHLVGQPVGKPQSKQRR